MNYEQILASLKSTLESDAVPASARKTGENLLIKLTSPVRIALLGLPNSGKSQLLNMLAGRKIIPDGVRLPTLELTVGPLPRTAITRNDQVVHHFDRIALDAADVVDAQSIFVEAPIPILEKISLLEAVSDGSLPGQTAAVKWASEHSDILIWCTQEFNDLELSLWNNVSDALKDHGFLVLTKADELHRSGVLSTRIAALQNIVADEFHSLLPVATLQAVAAVNTDGSRDEAALTASGGRAVLGAIVKHVEQGRRADVDNARLFLLRYGAQFTKEFSDARGPKPLSAISEIGGTRGGPRLVPQPGKGVVSLDEAASDKEDADRKLLKQALAFLQERAANLKEKLENGDSEGFESLLIKCAATADELTEMFSEHEISREDCYALQNDIMEASEMMLLLTLEKGVEPAEDAVTILLQIRREIELRLAA